MRHRKIREKKLEPAKRCSWVFRHSPSRVKYADLMNTPKPNASSYLTLTVFAAYFHAFMEWLFFVTQTSSSLSILSLLEKGKVLFVTGGVIAFVTLAGAALLSLPARKWTPIAFLPAALNLSITALILLDNFTYTLFKFGTVTTDAWRILYTLGFLLTFMWMLRTLPRQPQWKHASSLSLSLLAVSTVGILAIYFSRSTILLDVELQNVQAVAARPNIIIIGGDGLSASYLSAYGAEENTTPFLTSLSKTSLVAENAYTNASSTTASTTTALTGKEPAEVGVYRYPDILTNQDSYEHLPGMLKHIGYKTVEIGAPSYVDARKLNLLNGFDIVNNISFENPLLESLQPVLGNSPSAYFLQLVAERAGERLLHIFYIKDMENPFQQVTNPAARLTDAERVEQIIAQLENSDRPVYIFSHFMNTHGPHFSSETINTPEDSTAENEEWDVERYKVSIRSFDQHVKNIYTYLEESGKLNNTILVVYTDHGYRYVVNQRIPLLIRFPNGEHAGRIENNTQIIDMPPTLLNYLNIPQPEWMTGASLLKGELSAMREIVSITAGSPKKIKPPFYQIKTVQVIVCQKWYALNVQENEWNTGMIRGHTAPCDPTLLPSEEQIRQKILSYLEMYEYDISSLK
jgi:arylsulfatase A-like enzyme